jgi:hypothetical protein
MASLGLLTTINKTYTAEAKEVKEGAEDIEVVKKKFFDLFKELEASNAQHKMKHDELLKRSQNIIELLKMLPGMENQKEWLRIAEQWQEDDETFYRKMNEFWGKYKSLEAKAKSVFNQPLSWDAVFKLYQEFNNQFENEFELEEDSRNASDKLEDQERDLMIKELTKNKPKQEVEMWRQKKALDYDAEHDKLIEDQEKMRNQIRDELWKLQSSLSAQAPAGQ